MTDLELWYFSDLNNESDFEIVQNIDLKNKRIQFSVGMPSKAVKIIALILLLAFNTSEIEEVILEKVFNGQQSEFDKI